MTEDRASKYLQAKEIALQVIDLPAEERARILEWRCAGDPLLAEEVAWQLRLMEQDGESFLERDPLRQLEPDDDEIVHVAAPRDYRIIRRLGEGGHGVVFLAERTDGKHGRQVALKLLNFAGQLSPARSARFRAEGQILAQLNHTNIAHLVDAGALPDGRHFLAMEFIDGVMLTEYCDQHGLDTRERVRLFLKVCAAVSHAHQQLIIHRDLKPGNVLVTAEGEPKLLDFGIARLLQGAEDIAIPPTEEGQRLLTLAYASPEQLRNEPLATTSDVYGLGVMLYELVCGALPFGGEVNDPVRLTRDICETEPVRPSRRQATIGGKQASTGLRARSRRQVTPDLDAIILRTLRKKPEDRYESVHGLIDDLKRYLEDRPVLARRGDAVYRARRFIQRNRWAMAAASTFAVLLVAFSVSRQFELQRTQIERDKARHLAGFMVDLFRNADPSNSRGASITVKEVLDRSARDVLAGRQVDPRLRAPMLESIASAYAGLHLSAQAVPLFEEVGRIQAGYGATPTERAATERSIGFALSADAEYDASIARFDRAIALLEADGQDEGDADVLEARLGRLDSQVLLAREARAPLIAQYREIIAALEAGAARPNDLLIDAYSGLTGAYVSDGDAGAATAAAKRTMEVAARVHGADSPRTLAARRQYVQTLYADHPDQALPLYGPLVADHARVIGENNRTHALLLSDYATTLMKAGDVPAAIDVYANARKITAALVGPDDRRYLELSTNLAMALNKAGRGDEAIALLRETLPRLQAAQGGSGRARLAYAHALNQLAAALEKVDAAESLQRLQQADAALKDAPPQGYAVVHTATLSRMAKAQLSMGRFDEAEATIARLQAMEPAPGLRARAAQVALLLARKQYAPASRMAAESFALSNERKGACDEASKNFRQQYLRAQEAQGLGDAAKLAACARIAASGP